MGLRACLTILLELFDQAAPGRASQAIATAWFGPSAPPIQQERLRLSAAIFRYRFDSIQAPETVRWRHFWGLVFAPDSGAAARQPPGQPRQACDRLAFCPAGVFCTHEPALNRF